jgi:hypothetical protein
MAQWRSARRLGSQLGAKALKSRHGTSHLRARCEPLYHRVSFCTTFTMFLKLEQFIMLNSIIIQESM